MKVDEPDLGRRRPGDDAPAWAKGETGGGAWRGA